MNGSGEIETLYVLTRICTWARPLAKSKIASIMLLESINIFGSNIFQVCEFCVSFRVRFTPFNEPHLHEYIFKCFNAGKWMMTSRIISKVKFVISYDCIVVNLPTPSTTRGLYPHIFKSSIGTLLSASQSANNWARRHFMKSMYATYMLQIP